MPASSGGPWNPAYPTTTPSGSATAARAIQCALPGSAAIWSSRRRQSRRDLSATKYAASSTPATALACGRSPSSSAVIAAPGSSTNRTRFELARDDACRSISSVTVLMVAEHPDGVQRFRRRRRRTAGARGRTGRVLAGVADHEDEIVVISGQPAEGAACCRPQTAVGDPGEPAEGVEIEIGRVCIDNLQAARNAVFRYALPGHNSVVYRRERPAAGCTRLLGAQDAPLVLDAQPVRAVPGDKTVDGITIGDAQQQQPARPDRRDQPVEHIFRAFYMLQHERGKHHVI